MTMADVIETQPGANPGRVSFTTALEAARGLAAPIRVAPRRPSGQGARGSGSVGLWPECGGRGSELSRRAAGLPCRPLLHRDRRSLRFGHGVASCGRAQCRLQQTVQAIVPVLVENAASQFDLDDRDVR
jgi:hypothetical protein